MQKYHLHNRPDREITDKQEILHLLKNGKFATLSLCKNNTPYIVTLSYGYDESTNSFYFHCAKEGLKLEFIQSNSQVCATIIEDGGYIPNECGHYYKSLVFWGNIKILSDLEEKRAGMNVILNQLENDTDIIEKKLNSSQSLYEKMVVLKLEVSQICGKSGR